LVKEVCEGLKEMDILEEEMKQLFQNGRLKIGYR